MSLYALPNSSLRRRSHHHTDLACKWLGHVDTFHSIPCCLRDPGQKANASLRLSFSRTLLECKAHAIPVHQDLRIKQARASSLPAYLRHNWLSKTHHLDSRLGKQHRSGSLHSSTTGLRAHRRDVAGPTEKDDDSVPAVSCLRHYLRIVFPIVSRYDGSVCTGCTDTQRSCRCRC